MASDRVNMHEAKTRLSQLVAAIEDGGAPITICRAGRPVARLVPIEQKRSPRVPGALRGRIRMHDDFFEYDQEIAASFYGE